MLTLLVHRKLHPLAVVPHDGRSGVGFPLVLCCREDTSHGRTNNHAHLSAWSDESICLRTGACESRMGQGTGHVTKDLF